MKGLEPAEINTEHAEDTCPAAQDRFRPSVRRNLRNDDSVTVGDRTGRTGHAADGAIDAPHLIDTMDRSGLSIDGRNGTDVHAESAPCAVIQNQMGHGNYPHKRRLRAKGKRLRTVISLYPSALRLSLLSL
jgi:hypothetical protein